MSTTPDNGALAIRNSIAQVESALSELDKVSAGLADLAERHPVDLVFDVTSAKGMREAVAHRAAWRDPRLATERARKAAKAPVLALGRDIDARAAWITEQLLLGEEPVDKQIKLEQERQETLRREEALKESARITAIQEALADIHMEAMSVIGKSSEVIQAKIDEMCERELDPNVFQESMAKAASALKSAMDKLEMALAAAKHNEAEAARVAAERAELEQLRAAAKAHKEKDEAARMEAERERIREEEREKAVADQLALKEPVQDGWPKLEKPAKVIGTFGVGVSSRLVVEAAQRAYEYDGERKSKTPEQWREDERARRELWAAINGPLDDPEPAQDEHKALADAIHWPDCWDTAAYPTLASALSEVVASFRCTNQDTHTQDERKALAEPSKGDSE